MFTCIYSHKNLSFPFDQNIVFTTLHALSCDMRGDGGDFGECGGRGGEDNLTLMMRF